MVTWRGQSAVYTKGEREIMSALPVKEQAFVHLLKSFTDGEISSGSPRDERGSRGIDETRNPPSPRATPREGSSTAAKDGGTMAGSIPAAGTLATEGNSGEGVLGQVAATDEQKPATPSVYTDHEATVKSDTNPASDGNIPLYTDPDDIPFGKSARRKKTYAVAWSWRKHKIHKTKKRCEERLKVWKRWKERQGFTVIRFASGYLAELDGTREVIQLHEYDRETHERL